MSSIINASINLDKIDKSKLVKGEKGTYLNISIGKNRVTDENPTGEDQYGNTHYIQVARTKEEREQKVAPVYLGNGKEFIFNNTQPATSAAESEDDGLPF